jgi:hypothetical protein
VAGVVSLAVAVLVGDMGGSLAVTLNALRLARVGDDRRDAIMPHANAPGHTA